MSEYYIESIDANTVIKTANLYCDSVPHVVQICVSPGVEVAANTEITFEAGLKNLPSDRVAVIVDQIYGNIPAEEIGVSLVAEPGTPGFLTSKFPSMGISVFNNTNTNFTFTEPFPVLAATVFKSDILNLK